MAQREYLAEVDSFYMKANNYYSEDDFFTIIKANNNVPAWSKAGVSDNNLNSPIGVQELSTERSSASASRLTTLRFIVVSTTRRLTKWKQV